MEIRMVDTFLKIAQLHSFSKAAIELGYAQSTVTTQIQLLETELETQLFERIGNHIELTSAGEKFLDYAYECSNLFHSAKEVVKETNEIRGELRIGVVDSIATSILPMILKDFMSSYPAVNLTLLTDSSTELEKMLKNGSIDLAIYLGLDSMESAMIRCQTYEDSLIALCGKQNELRTMKQVAFSQLDHSPFILTEKECQYHKAIMRILKEQDMHPKVLLESKNTEIIKRFVEQDIGITFLPELTVTQEVNEKKLYPLSLRHPLLKVYIQAAYHKKKYPTQAMKEFLHQFDQSIREYQHKKGTNIELF